MTPDPKEVVADILRRYFQRREERLRGGSTDAPKAKPQRAPERMRPPNRPPCRFEGEIVSWCPAGTENLHVRKCLHDDGPDTCSRGHALTAERSCRDCPLWELVPVRHDAWTRHLLFHIYPVSGNGAWQRNVSRMVERLRLFNGKIVVAIAVDPPAGRKADPVGPHAPDRGRYFAPCDPPETVMAAFGEWRDRVEFLVVENDPGLREVATLVPLLERLPDAPGHCALYAQAKGTTRRPGHIAHRWNEAQFVVYLDYWPLVAEQLAAFPVTGAFKKLGPGWSPSQSKSDWHYSGSWFWFRTADLFARDWRTADRFWSGVEPYPSQQFLAAEAGTLFHEARTPQMNLYRASYWQAVVDPALAQWRKEHVRHFNATHGI